jgi:hypothetical protein
VDRDGFAVICPRSCHEGDNTLNLATMSGSRFSTQTTSSIVLSRDSENLIAPRSAVAGTFMARSTCDGSIEPDAQADPNEAAMPARFK